MVGLKILVLVVCFSSKAMAAQVAISPILPKWAKTIYNAQLAKDYDYACLWDPCVLNGDFDGDGKKDIAVLVRHKPTGKMGCVIIHSSGKSFVLGVDRNDLGGNWGAWVDQWRIYERGQVDQGAGEDIGTPPQLRGDGLLIKKSGSASALAYYNGKAYSWYQQED